MKSSWMGQMLDKIADLGKLYLELPIKKQSLKSMKHLCQTLLLRRGEASGTALAKEIVVAYTKMNENEKIKFLNMLTIDFAPKPETVLNAAQQYVKKQDFTNFQHLSNAIESPRLDLIRMINYAPGGIAAIIQMRRLLLKELKKGSDLLPLEVDLLHLLSAWFNRGFLQFQQIDWNTPAVILEKLIAYEAVHEIKGWHDLRRRLALDRRCFAFFHPALPSEPLIFVQVAFTKGIARNIQPLLNSKKESKQLTSANTAIFYSISNCQDGLKGISFGNFLIKQVVDYISKEIPNIKIFSTLSPIPKFRKWLEKHYLKSKTCVLSDEDKKLLSKPDWYKNKIVRKKLKKPLIDLCAQYLCQEKKRNHPYDPVTRFHLGNGAEIENINWEADLSNRGLSQSAGLMVNYRYNPSKIVANHEAYVNEGKIIISSKVKKILE